MSGLGTYRLVSDRIHGLKVVMTARIYKPAKSAMQSGLGRTKEWVLEYEQEAAREVDPLMGWTSSADTKQQLKLTFESKEEAVAYAVRAGVAYAIEEPQPRKTIRKAYADNFKFGRVGAWTH
jgi:ETC complex I subunit conserved region